MVREEPGKQKSRSCRAQELARSSAQGNERQKKVWPTELSKRLQETRSATRSAGTV